MMFPAAWTADRVAAHLETLYVGHIWSEYVGDLWKWSAYHGRSRLRPPHLISVETVSIGDNPWLTARKERLAEPI